MSALRRTVDKFNGVKLCDMNPDELHEFLLAIAERGAFNALTSVGLGDKYASSDVRKIRAVLRGYNLARKFVWQTFWLQIKNLFIYIGKVISAVIVFLLIRYLFKACGAPEQLKQFYELLKPWS